VLFEVKKEVKGHHRTNMDLESSTYIAEGRCQDIKDCYSGEVLLMKNDRARGASLFISWLQSIVAAGYNTTHSGTGKRRAGGTAKTKEGRERCNWFL